MSAKVLVLILAASLLGAVPQCRCESHVRAEAKPSSCGHCPPERAPRQEGCPVSDCSCVHEGADRAFENPFSVPSIAVAMESWLYPPNPEPPVAAPPIESMGFAGDVRRRASPPLCILFRHFNI